MSNEKTPWRKNLDKRYISGEDLLMGEAMGKGLKKEMVVTIVKFHDAPTFDQKKQEEVDKTAVWLKDHATGKMLYKPMIINVRNGEKMSKLLSNNSAFIDDFSTEIPFIIYACPDKRHGHVVAVRQYNAPPQISDTNALSVLNKSTSIDELANNWNSISVEEKKLPTVLACKERLKQQLL